MKLNLNKDLTKPFESANYEEDKLKGFADKINNIGSAVSILILIASFVVVVIKNVVLVVLIGVVMAALNQFSAFVLSSFLKVICNISISLKKG